MSELFNTFSYQDDYFFSANAVDPLRANLDIPFQEMAFLPL